MEALRRGKLLRSDAFNSYFSGKPLEFCMPGAKVVALGF